jgi:hypothetical protein
MATKGEVMQPGILDNFISRLRFIKNQKSTEANILVEDKRPIQGPTKPKYWPGEEALKDPFVAKIMELRKEGKLYDPNNL